MPEALLKMHAGGSASGEGMSSPSWRAGKKSTAIDTVLYYNILHAEGKLVGSIEKNRSLVFGKLPLKDENIRKA